MRPRLKRLNQQTIVITGSSSGMGLATARQAVAAGADVFLAARDGVALAAICAELNASGPGSADLLAVDVGDEMAVARLANAVIERFGGFDTWVNVAGVGLIGELKDTTTEDHRRLFETNYWGLVYGSLEAARRFRQRGGAGTIINVGSAASDIPLPISGAYAASKHAVKAFTNVLRIELRHEGLPVSVTLIKPSAVDSNFTEHARTMLGRATVMPPPRYTPGVVASAILGAARKPIREIAVGASAVLGGAFAQLFPNIIERLFCLVDPMSATDKDRPAPPADNLHAAPTEGRERSGRYSARAFSLTTAAQIHPWPTLLIIAVAGLCGVGAVRARRT